MGLNIASYPGFELSGLPLQNVIQLSYFAAQVSSLPIIAVRFKMFNFFLFCLVIIVNIALNISIVIWKHICYCLKVFFFIFISFSENQLNIWLVFWYMIYLKNDLWFLVKWVALMENVFACGRLMAHFSKIFAIQYFFLILNPDILYCVYLKI